ncbi:phosphoribosylanthranilate isomerase [Acidiphilium sp. PA]|uniref:phosphoribosylanthranilate isomerase n=1 Tax=Acidiphilium sp. PA TaxID=2871705 RepID=UPI002244E563|nr:phosphoribosylanthranilate isomerase [Acidiphilium sp. PA]MCW8305711.1 phosphoribosylanthranilate isomerase [Acidiphilium sp. PA]
MARSKICGINTPAAYRAAVDAGADWVGLNFYPRSPRYITGPEAAALGADGTVTRVGLFVAPDAAMIATVLAATSLDVLQLYTDAATCRALRAAFGLPVWRAVGVAAAADLPDDDEGLDGFIIESKPPAGADRPGGNAVALDWTVTQAWQAPAPWLLAGGLTPDNVAEAITRSGATAVDVSSGVETAPGVKSADLMRQFVRAARGA